MIITFSGLDGAGKSTQIECLSERLLSEGYHVKVVWARGGYTHGFEFLKKLLRRLMGKKLVPSGQSKDRTQKLERPIIQKIWLTIAILDLIFLWGLYVRLLGNRERIVICDRYLNDTLLDFRKNFSATNVEESILWRLLTAITPAPDHAFLFWVPIETSMQRSIDKAEPFPDSKETLEWRLAAYMDQSTFPLHKYALIDGRNSITKNSEELYASIKFDLA